MRSGLLVADVDDADALVDAAVVDVDDVAAAEREIVSTPSALSALATRWPPEMTFASVLLRLSVSSAVVVSRALALTAASAMGISLRCIVQSR
jgi:hypothetical protein